MDLKIIWPGKTHHPAIRALQDGYLKKIERLGRCRLIETREARGIDEKHVDRILEVEAAGLEKQIGNDYLVCLTDKGESMSSERFAAFLEKTALSRPHPIAFMVGGFLGLADSLVERAQTRISLSEMTFSHEMARIMLLEQIYRALSILKGLQYAK